MAVDQFGPVLKQPVNKVMVRISRGEDDVDISLTGGSAVTREKLVKVMRAMHAIAMIHEAPKPIEPVYVRITPTGRSTVLYLGGGTAKDREEVLKYLARNLSVFVTARNVEPEHRNYSRVPGEESYYLDLQRGAGTAGQRGQLVRTVLARMPLLASRTTPRVRLVHREDFPHEIK